MSMCRVPPAAGEVPGCDVGRLVPGGVGEGRTVADLLDPGVEVVHPGVDGPPAGLRRVGAQAAALPGRAVDRHQLHPARGLPYRRTAGVALADGAVRGGSPRSSCLRISPTAGRRGRRNNCVCRHRYRQKYNKSGKHQVEFGPYTGEQTKPKDRTREVEK
ncbi:colicin E3/pyocin S6 family cytotoxin [Streptomyces sp. BP-8]|uniref:colicin E3/pyocin S6 family cytotoxin n=1 Tax=Streptomyces sirii TaxID=3127701 RepID=UPI00388D6D46